MRDASLRGSIAHAGDQLRNLSDVTVLSWTFRTLLAVAAAMLVLDIRDLSLARTGGSIGLPTTGPVRMDRPAPNDQIRPYLPRTRPLDPDDPIRSRPRGADEAAPMQFRLGTGGAAFADGTITPGTADAFAEFLASDAAAGISEIVLHSPGGSVADALAMARLIHDKGMDTRVVADGYCASSCPLVFAAGKERTATATSWIGVHQVFALTNAIGSLADGMDQAQRVRAEAQLQLVDFGVDARVWIHAMQTPPDKLYLFTPEELADLKLATEVKGLEKPEPIARGKAKPG
jgi:hypothetical protein